MTRIRIMFMVGIVALVAGLTSGSPAQASDCPGGLCIPYTTWAACGAFADKDKQVADPMRRKKISAQQIGHYVTLRCGTSSYGYRHIAARHLADWEGKSSYIGRNWRDLADWSMRWVLKDPGKITYSDENDTWCYSRKFSFVVDGEVIMKMIVRVVSGTTSRRLITSFPTTTSPCRGANLL